MSLRGHTLDVISGGFYNAIKVASCFRRSAYVSSALLSLLVLAILCPLYLIPDSSEAAAGTATESTLTFTFVDNKNTASVSLDVSNTAGTFASSSSSELAEFSLTTNNATGYTLKLKTTGSTTADTSLVNGANNITSINASKTSSTFASNTWGLLPSKYRSSNTTITNDSLNPTFFPADTTGFTMDETSNANNVANTYTVGLGIKADFTIPAGTYTNSTIIVEYVANAVNYSTTYDKGNITGTPNNIPATQSGAITSTSITLSSTVPTITGYTFTGWCLGTVTTPANETDTCSGTVYNPNGGGTNLSFGIDQTTTNTVTLHAMWSKATVAVTVNFAGTGVTGVTFTNATYGNQSVSTSGGTANLKYGVQYAISGTYSSGYGFDSWSATAGTLGSASSASTTYSTSVVSSLTLTGKFDGVSMQEATYSNCGELMYDDRGTAAYKNIIYTTAEINDLCWMTRNLDLPGGTTLTPSDTNLTTGFTLPTSTTPYYASDYDEDFVYNSNSTTCSSGNPCYSYYSYYTATAHWGTTDVMYESSPVDICPKGWRLPTQAEFVTLANTYTTGSSMTSYPFLGVYNGRLNSDEGDAFIGTYGFYWSSTSSDFEDAPGRQAYYLTFENSWNSAVPHLNKYYGHGIRCVKEPPYLYNAVAAMSKGTQTAADLQATITTANSGVYEYNTSVFGAATDAASTHTIYYYRGILDQTTGSYGSDGDGKAWPNYVILDANGTKDTSDTCWRIVRTTGSGGIKMIYNGKWTGSTCANATTAAQVTTNAFGSTDYAVSTSIVSVGYTQNANYASTSATTATAYSTLFGSNSSYSGNSTASDMKTYLEGTWFTNISSYENILEKSAGWCNDRSIRSSDSSTSVISDSTKIVPRAPYGTLLTVYYFGSYVRTETTSDKPTLGCPRSNADLYTTSSATNGNKQLGKPVALLTADEAAFAGSGYDSSTTPYHANSYLRSGSYFWLFSPSIRFSSSEAGGFILASDGYLSTDGVYAGYGVRPSISLVSGTAPASGSGTATDPWVVQP